MKHLTDSIRELCTRITDRQISNPRTDQEIIGEMMREDRHIVTRFLDKTWKIIIEPYREKWKLEEIYLVDFPSNQILSKKEQIVFDRTHKKTLLAILWDDIEILEGDSDYEDSIRKSLSLNQKHEACGVYIKDDYGLIKRTKPAEEWGNHYYITLATEADLEKVLTVLHNLL